MSAETETAPVLTESQANLGRLFDTLGRDPKHRKDVLRLIKAANPDQVIPEYDLEQEFDTRVADRVKPHEEKIAKLESDLAALKGHVSRESWRGKVGLSDEELVEVETLAKEEGITKGDTAVEYWRMKNALGTPRGTGKPADDTYRQELARAAKGGPGALKAAATKQAQKVLQELRGGRIRSA